MVRLAHEALELPDTVGLGDPMVVVGEEGERQMVFLLELRLLRHCVWAYTDDHRIESLEPREGVAKLARLDGSTRCVSLGEEVEHHPASAKVRERDCLPVVVVEREVGGLHTGCNHESDSPPMRTAIIAFCMWSLFSASSQTRL